MLAAVQTRLPVTDEEWIAACVDDFNAEAQRGDRFIHAGGRGVHTHTDGEKVIVLPNGHRLRVHTDASGSATHINDDEHLHAIARPQPVRLTLDLKGALRGTTR